ncbi:MAG: formate dehydrogenase subunit alpha [Betaproteobacteria bacterium TMED156]|nr:MAG: formate dehydrogenase subunit alpha [Betaproteobacteria bacterium TMED156]
MNAPENFVKNFSKKTVNLKLNGESVDAFEGETILDLADRHNLEVPRLCYKTGYRNDGNCRSCVVEIKGERVLAPSCCRTVQEGMEVETNNDRSLKSQNLVLEMLLSDMPSSGYKWEHDNAEVQHGELSSWAKRKNVVARQAYKDHNRAFEEQDDSHPAMLVNLSACIQCDRCVRACREEQANDVIGVSGRGASSKIIFDLDSKMGESTCVACGECVQACPTGALMPKSLVGNQKVDREVDSVCPFCGVGCLLTYKVKDEKIVAVDGRDGPANHSRLCVKGRFGFDYAHDKSRLTKPLVRKKGMKKDPTMVDSLNHWSEVFREATWEEALELASGGLKKLRDQYGFGSLAGLGSAKGSNEEAYLFQKLVRTGFRNNNVDHCTRLCHASSVAALLEGVGSGAVSNQVSDVSEAELVIIIGSNPTENHPVAATWMKNAANNGTKIVLIDPRMTTISKHAWKSLKFNPGSDVSLLNSLLNVIIQEELTDENYIKNNVNNFDDLKQKVKPYSPEVVSKKCGIEPETIKEVARAYAKSQASMILWGMGVSQHIHGTDNARCLIALATITGQIGRPGTGLHPLRGQNNVQGASDAGLIPMMLPNYQKVVDSDARQKFEKFWNSPLDEKPGYTVTEIMDKVFSKDNDPHKIRGLYIMGENPAMSDPNLNHARSALACLELLVVQDIFMTETAWLADVVLPASAWPEKTGTVSNTDRMVQMGRKAIDCPGDARQDLWIIQEMAKGLGLKWKYNGPDSGVAEVYDEMRHAMKDAIWGITWKRLEDEQSVTYPCLDENLPGESVVFKKGFPTKDGKANLVPADPISPNEIPDLDYPFVFITGRQLEHWHTGSMTRRASILNAIEPAPTFQMCRKDIEKHNLFPGQICKLSSRRGSVIASIRQDESTPEGTIFMGFAYREAAANLLTNNAIDPVAKIPEFKYCAVKIVPIIKKLDSKN